MAPPAFADTMKHPQFVGATNRMPADLAPSTGEQLEAFVAEALSFPSEIMEFPKEALRERKPQARRSLSGEHQSHLPACLCLHSGRSSEKSENVEGENLMGVPERPMGKYLPWMVWSYRHVEPYSFALMRFFCGATFVVHGYARLFTDNQSFGMNPAVDWLTPSGVGMIELVGGALIAFGLITRPAALALAALWFLFTIGATPNGKQHWLMLGAFDHYPAMLMLLSVGVLMRGGGHYSLDRLIGREF